MNEISQKSVFEVSPECHKQRLDVFLVSQTQDISRSRLQALIKKGNVSVDNQIVSNPSFAVSENEVVGVTIPAPDDALPLAQDIPLDILYEDDDLLVINKQVGLVVHPGAGVRDGTLVNALLYHCGDSLSGVGGVRRPGIVHRLDKDTSGLMMVAKNDLAHQGLAAQLADRTLSREYLALVTGAMPPGRGKVDASIGRHLSQRIKMAVTSKNSKNAITHYRNLEKFGDALTLVSCKLQTGRTHQIRVHMQYLGFPLVGDSLYGQTPTKTRSLLRKSGYDEAVQDAVLNFPRQALHARKIGFVHPRSGDEMEFTAELPQDLEGVISLLKQ